MPSVIDYARVMQQIAGQGFISLYYNSGAFGFPPTVATHSVGWIGTDDSTIRPEAIPLTRKVHPPVESSLSELGTKFWLTHLPGRVWVTPKSHWAYELDFGSHLWMPGALQDAGLATEQIAALSQRHDGSAVEFTPGESRGCQSLLLALLTNLFGSDFQLTFPTRQIVCTVHHHKQLWWTTSDTTLFAALNSTVPSA